MYLSNTYLTFENILKYLFSKIPIENPRQLLKWIRFEFGAKCFSHVEYYKTLKILPFAMWKLANGKYKGCVMLNENVAFCFHLINQQTICRLPVSNSLSFGAKFKTELF